MHVEIIGREHVRLAVDRDGERLSRLERAQLVRGERGDRGGRERCLLAEALAQRAEVRLRA